MKFINESMYWLGTGRICNCLNRLLHEVLRSAPAALFSLEVLWAVWPWRWRHYAPSKRP